MFVCRKCKKVDNFDLMLSHGYQGEGKVEKIVDANGKMMITVDGYTFVPDLDFMNNYAVCGYCGGIYCWDYSKQVK